MKKGKIIIHFDGVDEEEAMRLVDSVVRDGRVSSSPAGEPGNRPNLRALCQRCHNRHDAEYRRANARLTIARKKGQQSLFSE